MNSRNEREGELWVSIDNLMDLLEEVIIKGADIRLVSDIRYYIMAELDTILTKAHINKLREELKNGD